MSDTVLQLVPPLTDEERRAKRLASKRARSPAYYAANRERLKAKAATWYVANKERAKALRLARYAKNKEREKVQQAAYNAVNSEKFPRYRAKWAAKDKERNPERAKVNQRRRLYGMTPETFDVLLQVQEGRCAVCRLPFCRGCEPNVDHDHSTGRVRGLLCRSCNHGLGNFRDNLEALAAAMTYLRPKEPA